MTYRFKLKPKTTEKMITIEILQRAKPALSLSAVLNAAFKDKRDAVRVRTKIDRGTPELTVVEAKAVATSLASYGIKLEEL